MNKPATITTIAVSIGLALAFSAGYLLSPGGGAGDSGDGITDQNRADAERKVLFWRNPMNPAITSPTFMKDEMGMDYLPVYADDAPAKDKERKVLFWRNPMNPAITSPTFMQDEMGMDYLPVYADDGGSDKAAAGTVSIDPVTVQNIGVRTAVVKQQTLSRQLNALGRVDFNEERLARLHPKTSGWIEQLHIDATGTRVQRDDILLSVYSPDLVAVQREHLVALSTWEKTRNNKSSPMALSAKSVLTSTRERLESFDVPPHQIKELEKSRKVKRYLHIHSPFAGRIMNIGAREGQYITPKDELYLIADLRRIWVYADVYEDELPWIKVGDKAQMRVRAAPGRRFDGTVSFIYPTLDSKTRTVRVRLEFDNLDLILKPGMFANVVLFADAHDNVTVVPSEAIVRSGSREQVFVQRAPGKFEPREVGLGFSAAGYTQITHGVSAGEQVVVSAQFLIDSESKLREATAKMLQAMQGGSQQTQEQGAAHQTIDHKSMDHSTMDHNTMDPKSMDHETMDHETMDHKTMDHKTMDHKTTAPKTMNHDAMDPKSMDHETMDHKTMDHKNMDHKITDPETMNPETINHSTAPSAQSAAKPPASDKTPSMPTPDASDAPHQHQHQSQH